MSNYGKTTAAMAAASAALAMCVSNPAAAQRGPFGGGGFGDSFGIYGSSRIERGERRDDAREGHVESVRFMADGVSGQLGRGAIRVQILPGSSPDERSRLDYEAALLDRLGAAGYDIAGDGKGAPQVARVSIHRDVAEPAEQKRSPVSGQTSIGVSNRGSAMGMAVNVDFTKPRKALLSTEMKLQIVDAATDAVLWEARADILTRDQDEDWTDADVAQRLSAALLQGFPTRAG